MDQIVNEVLPFKAISYNPAVIGNIGHCLAQPYDVVSEELVERYYSQCPYNVIRLTLNKKMVSDNETTNRYTRARAIFDDWMRKGVLIESEKPLFWAYEQEFTVPDGKDMGVKKVLDGFIGLVRLRDYSERAILPHEKVLKKPLEDRIKLAETTKVQLEYIWGIYNDNNMLVDNMLQEKKDRKLFVDYYDEPDGVTHRLWKVEDKADIELIKSTLGGRKIYLADGHHRYQAMLEVRNRMRKLYPNAGPNAPWEYIIMYLVNMKNAGLTILPTHRLLHDLKINNLDGLSNRIEKYFHVKSYPFHNGEEKKARADCLEDLKKTGSEEHKFCAYIKKINRYYLLKLKNSEAYERLIDMPYSSDWKLLDVNIINTLLFRKILGLTEDSLSDQTNITYVKDINGALMSVRQGKSQVALILNSPELKDIINVAGNGERMPRKATYFYPKPLSGLVFYRIA